MRGAQSLGQLASSGIFWSLLQSWSARTVTFATFVVLAHFLSPAEYGIASAASSCVLLIATVAEFGFGDALIQRRNLVAAEANLPFAISLMATAVLAALTAAFSERIESQLDAPGLAPVLAVMAFVAPLTAMSMFQEAAYRRALEFRGLALRVVISNGIAAPVAILCAYLGTGVWSLVVQTYLTTIIGLFWLWRRPRWKPSLEMRPLALRQLSRFALPVVSMRMIDFSTMRLVDVIIVYRFGIAALGLYSVGARIYQTLMQLLQSALNDVSLPILSSISDQQSRLREIYLRAVVISSILAAPVFVLFAALSPEVCDVLFGAKWVGVDAISRPLLLVGAVQCVQFLNGPYLSARGRPNLVLGIGVVKYGAMIAGLLLVPGQNTIATVAIFAALQLVATPLTFIAVSRELSLSIWSIVANLLPALASSAVAFGAVQLSRPYVATISSESLLLGGMLGGIFVAAFAAVLLATGRKQLRILFTFALARLGSRSSRNAAGTGA